MKFHIIVADPPWPFKDRLRMSATKRGADAQYKTMTIPEIKYLDVKSIAAEKAVLAMWCPSSLLVEGLDIMKAWGFEYKQTFIWVKTKKSESVRSKINKWTKKPTDVVELLNSLLNFKMGHLFRQTHELVLLGVRGKGIYNNMANRSQISVNLYPATKHSEKPDALQDALYKIFPKAKKLEMFARRDKKGWQCVGFECPSTLGEDIRDSIKKLS